MQGQGSYRDRSRGLEAYSNLRGSFRWYESRRDWANLCCTQCRHPYDGPTDCGAAAGFEITTIILLISLVATTAGSAYLLRQIEQSMPEVAVLPPGKMVTQSDQLMPFVSHPIDNVKDENSESADGNVIPSTPV